jgi:DNA-binding response OmpR family regulator
MQILLVEDDPISVKFVRRLLERYHTKLGGVHVATTVEEAQTLLLNEDPFSLALVDWELPDASGLALIRWLRELPMFESLPIIMMTGRGTAEDVLEAMEAGADDYLVKPMKGKSLLDKMEKHL